MVVEVISIVACLAALCFPVATFASALREVPNGASRSGSNRRRSTSASAGPAA
jgi:hypothetical protein